MRDKERKEVIDYVVARVIEKGQLAPDTGAVRKYNLGLPYSFTYIPLSILGFKPGISYNSLPAFWNGILDKLGLNEMLGLNQKNFFPVIEFIDPFAEPKYNISSNWQDQSFDEVRTLYRGGHEGLVEIVAQGIYHSDFEGKALMPAESLLRSRAFNDERKLSLRDSYKFDNFLKYAQQEL